MKEDVAAQLENGIHAFILMVFSVLEQFAFLA